MLRYPFREFNYLVPEACKFCVNFTVELTDISEGSVRTKENCNTLIIKTSTKVLIEFIRKNITNKSC